MKSCWDSAGARLCPQDQSQRGKGERGLENFSRLLCANKLRLTEPRSVKKPRRTPQHVAPKSDEGRNPDASWSSKSPGQCEIVFECGGKRSAIPLLATTR